jgi:4-hydroxy-tetrahydrodipicolinate reductase
MERMKIIVVGAGKLANAILNANLSFQTGDIVKWESQYQTSNEAAVVVHAGSGRQLKECIEFCRRTKNVFIELSTGLETETMSPDFPLVICPNTSILVLKTLCMIKANGKHFENYEISITESHQSTKVTEPGTAYAFADSFKVPVSEITSIRNPDIQLNAAGIPEEYLDKHAYHKIEIKDGNDKITLETKVLGHDSYANGVKLIVEAILKTSLKTKRYSVLDLIDSYIL